MVTDVGGIPMVQTGGCNNGDCGMGGMWAVILIVALLGGGMFGRGHDGGDDRHQDVQFSNIQNEIRNNEQLNQMRFDNLQQTQLEQSIFAEVCGVNRNVDSAKYDNALIAKNAEIMQLKCCCDTQKQMAEGFGMLAQKMDCNTIQTLRDKVTALELSTSQCAQNAYLVNTLRPYPSPSYMTCNPTQSIYPPIGFGYGGPGFGGGFRDGFRDGFRNDGCCC